MKAGDMKYKVRKIELLDGEHNVTMDFNAYEELENYYGDIGTALGVFTGAIKVADMKKFLCSGINACLEDETQHYTPFKIGKLLDEDKIVEYIDTLVDLLDKSLPEKKEIDEDNEDEDEKK